MAPKSREAKYVEWLPGAIRKHKKDRSFSFHWLASESSHRNTDKEI
jgi:hypothetical protein